MSTLRSSRQAARGRYLPEPGTKVDEVDPGERVTGTRDEHYNLVSALYPAWDGAETLENYVLNAEMVGDE